MNMSALFRSTTLHLILAAALYNVKFSPKMHPLRSKGIGEWRLNCLQNSEKSLNEMTRFNPLEIERYYDGKPLIVWERIVDIGGPILGWWVLRRCDEFMFSFRNEEERMHHLNMRAADLKDAIVQGKSVTFIKSGQALALRPDIVKSPEYIRELQKLQDEVGTFDSEVAMQIIREELGRDPYDVYKFDPPVPIASASIGQVYKATLIETNATVAVKVQRPDALRYAALDMYLIRKLAGYVKKQKKLRTDLVGIADEFGKQLFSELNYEQEARNCNRFRDLYGNIPGIYVPTAFSNLTRQRVLTMEFVEGLKGPWEVNGERMLTVGLQCSVIQLLGSGYFHSDPHRGNLLQTPNTDLAYIDFGMMSEVPAQERFALFGLVLGLVNKDLPLVISNLKILDFFPPDTDSAVMVSALQAALKNSTEGGSVSSLNFTKLSQNLERISYLLPFRLPPFYSLIIRTLTILEGLALTVDPSFRLIQGAYPFIAKQILSSSSPELQALLKSVLISPTGRIRWNKLEEFISISANADKAVKGDFQALKQAQDRSDVIKALTGSKAKGNFTLSATVLILDFLMSENGRFLRDPLIDEVVETVDALGLTAVASASLLSGGLLPQPAERPDRERVDQFVKLLSILSEALVPNQQAGSGQSPAGDQTEVSRENVESRTSASSSGLNSGSHKERVKIPASKSAQEYAKNEGDVNATSSVTVLLALMERVVSLVRNPPSEADLAPLIPIVDKALQLLVQVAARLVERNVRRTVRSIINPPSIQSVLPAVSRIIDSLMPSR